MARSTPEIYDALIAEKNNQATLNTLQPNIDSSQKLLSDLSEPDAVEDWRLWLWIVAYMTHVLEGLFDLFKIEIETTQKAQKYGTLPWLIEQAKAFQYGHALVWTGSKFAYAVVDEGSRIVNRVSINNTSGINTVKVLKANGVVLTAPEQTAFFAYMLEVYPPGIGVEVITAAADTIKTDLKIYYDSLVMAADGSLLSDPLLFPVKTAINNYLNAIIFNGDFVGTSLIDAIQDASGVANPVATTISYKYAALPYAAMPDNRIAFSGHYDWSEADSTITYLANV